MITPDDFDQVGRLSLVDLSDYEFKFLLSFLARSKDTSVYDFLFEILGPDRFLRFLDLFSGEVLRIPKRDPVLKTIENIQIFSYIYKKLPSASLSIEAVSISDHVIEQASKTFGKKKSSIRQLYDKVRIVLLKNRSDV